MKTKTKTVYSWTGVNNSIVNMKFNLPDSQWRTAHMLTIVTHTRPVLHNQGQPVIDNPLDKTNFLESHETRAPTAP